MSGILFFIFASYEPLKRELLSIFILIGHINDLKKCIVIALIMRYCGNEIWSLFNPTMQHYPIINAFWGSTIWSVEKLPVKFLNENEEKNKNKTKQTNKQTKTKQKQNKNKQKTTKQNKTKQKQHQQQQHFSLKMDTINGELWESWKW